MRATFPACWPAWLDATPHHVVDNLGGDPGARRERLEHMGGQIGGVDLGQGAAAASDRGRGPRRRSLHRAWYFLYLLGSV